MDSGEAKTGATVAADVKKESAAAVLRWTPPAAPAEAAWNVYRGEGARPWNVALKCVAKAVKGTTFRDAQIARGMTATVPAKTTIK